MNLLEKNTKKVSQRSKGTMAIILINVVVYMLLFTGVMENEALMLSPNLATVLERSWTLISVFFTHENILHLVANMLLFYLFGKTLETLKGSKAVILVYVLAGLLGSLGALLVSSLINATDLMLGASAAVFGVVSAVGVISPKYRLFNSESKMMRSLFSATAIQFTLILLAINVILYILNPNMSVSVVAHTIGLLAGAVCGYLLRKRK